MLAASCKEEGGGSGGDEFMGPYRFDSINLEVSFSLSLYKDPQREQ